MNDYPDYDSMDEVLYRLGQVLYVSGRAAEALPQLSKLLEVYPTSPWANDARALMEQAAKAPPPTRQAAPPPPLPSPAPDTEPGTPPSPVPATPEGGP